MIRKFANAQVLDAWRVPAGNSARALRKAAHRVSFAYTPRPGYLYVRARAISSRTNDNWDTFPAGEIEKGYRTFLGKPCFINHHNANHRRARGVIVAAALHHDRNPDGSPDTWVELLHEIDAQRFPKLARAILAGRVNRTSMGVDCEHSTCSACGNKATSPAEYCQHMPGKKGMRFRKRGADGKVREGLIHEICAGLTFFENSFLVEDPADPTAHVLDKPYLHATAAARPAAPGLLAHFAGRKEAFTVTAIHPEAECPSCGEPVSNAEQMSFSLGGGGAPVPSSMATCHRCGTIYDASRSGEQTRVDRESAQMAHSEHVRGRAEGDVTFGHVTEHPTRPLIGWGEGPELLRQRRTEEHQNIGPGGVPLDPQRPGVGQQMYRYKRERVMTHSEPFRIPEGPVRREHLSARQAGWEGQEAADADNLYRVTGCHHTSCGRTLQRHTAAAGPDIIEERLHHPSDPAVQPVRLAIDGARAYSARAGLGDPHGGEPYGSIETNPGRIRRLAHAYHALPMNDPGAHAAFADMARQVHHQYDHLTSTMGVHVESVDHDPYASHLEMTRDLDQNRHLAVLSTRATGPHTFFDDDTNDKFRAVHDAFGHAATGRSFDRHGEEAAWLAHSRMFSGPARHAMTTETRGQNSMLIATGKFPPQKTALLPAEFLHRDAALRAEAAPRYPDPADHPWFKAVPMSKDNIKAAWYDSTDDEKVQGKNWYPDAHLVAKGIANGDAALGAGLLSAYSPRTKWPANMFHAARTVHLGRALSHSTGDGPIMDMHTNPAARILAGEHHSQVLKGPKTRAFASLIEHGGQNPEDEGTGRRQVVIDRHAMSVAAGKRLSDKEAVSAPIDKPHYYHHVAQKYFDAADEVSAETGKKVTAEHMQATTWLRQVRVNDAEDAAVGNAFGGGGRVQKGLNDQKRWEEHVRQYHPEMKGQTMHASIHTAADPPLRVPPSVDTLRPEACPVCGDQDVFKGQRCPVCGFVAPPDIFRDPDIEHARMMRQELEENKETSPYPEGPADEEQLAAGQPGAEPGMNPEQIGSGEDADEQLLHPDQIAPDGVPGVQPDATAPGQGMLEPTGDEEELAGPGELDENGEPAEPEDEQLEGAQLEEEGQEEQAEGEQLEEQGAEGQQEEQGEQEMEPEPGSPGKDQDEDERPGGKKMTKQRTAATAAVTAQQRVIDELRRENARLSAGLAFIASLAGVTDEMDAICRQADLANPAQPVPDPPQAPPTSTTEQALETGAPTGSGNATVRGPGHTTDDPSRPGATPGSMTAVPAESTTTPLTPGVEIPTAPAGNLQDVTAPVQGTNPSQDGGVPIEQRRIETDVRVNPDPLAAKGPGIGGQGTDGTAFPWMIAARQELRQDGPQSPEDERGARTFAAIRLAKLRIQAGLVRGDELELATCIERDAALSLHDIEMEIGTLGQVSKAAAVASAQPRYPRGMAPRTAARTAPSFSGEPAPVMAMTAGVVAGDDDGDLFD